MDIDTDCITYHYAGGRFNPRYPYGYRLDEQIAIRNRLKVSIHDTRMDIDWVCPKVLKNWLMFQSTIPVWISTVLAGASMPSTYVSIHDTRMDIDSNSLRIEAQNVGFNPRYPYGYRRLSYLRKKAVELFQSTIPVWISTTCERPD